MTTSGYMGEIEKRLDKLETSHKESFREILAEIRQVNHAVNGGGEVNVKDSLMFRMVTLEKDMSTLTNDSMKEIKKINGQQSEDIDELKRTKFSFKVWLIALTILVIVVFILVVILLVSQPQTIGNAVGMLLGMR